MNNHRHPDFDQGVELLRAVVRHIDASVGAVPQIHVPAECRLPGRIVEADAAVGDAHPERDRGAVLGLSCRGIYVAHKHGGR